MEAYKRLEPPHIKFSRCDLLHSYSCTQTRTIRLSNKHLELQLATHSIYAVHSIPYLSMCHLVISLWLHLLKAYNLVCWILPKALPQHLTIDLHYVVTNNLDYWMHVIFCILSNVPMAFMNYHLSAYWY